MQLLATQALKPAALDCFDKLLMEGWERGVSEYSHEVKCACEYTFISLIIGPINHLNHLKDFRLYNAQPLPGEPSEIRNIEKTNGSGGVVTNI